MEQGLGSETLDKSRVLNVKPLRCLEPMFPPDFGSSQFSSPQSANFVCAPPTGPFPPGVTSFFPFLSQNGSLNQATPFDVNHAVQSPTPIRSFRTPMSQNGNGYPMNFGDESSSKSDKSKGSSKKMKNSQIGDGVDVDAEVEVVANSFFSSYDLTKFHSSRLVDQDKETVDCVLMMFDLLRRRIAQHDDSGNKSSSLARNANLKAGAILLNKGIRTCTKKRIGSVSGIDVGDIFFFRMELCVVGMHAPSMSGIDYMSMKTHSSEECVAVSIVSSGGYEDVDDGDVLIYSGQGGNMYKKAQDTISDQKLVKGNLALEKSLHQGNDVRVIRGVKDIAHPTGKVYIYDGIYRVQESWIEKVKGGYNIFKYKLGRKPGQPQAFTMWKSIQQWKESISSRTGVILPDLTSGAENLPVCLVNEVDEEKSPGYFTYSSSLKNPKPINSPQPSTSCSCRGGCQPGNSNCGCIQKNGGFLPYTSLGVLLNSNSLIYECGSSCSCPLNCRGKISQAGLKVRLEVFKTNDKGWGLRSWDPIRAGAFICEYAGEVVTSREVDNNYIFDTTRSYKPFDVILRKQNELLKVPYPLVISSKDVGNVARFMNHSCDPDVYWQLIVRENKNESNLHVGLFAIKHIPPMKELTFDYGVVESEKEERKKKCLCGSPKCSGYYF
ncbi:histone-lysine N-methyltransferase, H3 lysine-9 specific SUVH1-like [Impatiens glandulifera]|uniref:histone-lysine N-methyltransferase, H3 lysine-9 specific SUVH1-like n=1 Tax=Impatiens glandulifera TaxID=253017 RepID=UPI001FB160CD|nr:histone-lysine N-methyltransferase, H3 lysine-9 specific SUVH1-like [Impatiens glandulifera]XP_047309087.1 histone-lysine N-methyltransferase, H3 lysine-9 specific SUVH1-like [Impatiens glandulifera]